MDWIGNIFAKENEYELSSGYFTIQDPSTKPIIEPKTTRSISSNMEKIEDTKVMPTGPKEETTYLHIDDLFKLPENTNKILIMIGSRGEWEISHNHSYIIWRNKSGNTHTIILIRHQVKDNI